MSHGTQDLVEVFITKFELLLTSTSDKEEPQLKPRALDVRNFRWSLGAEMSIPPHKIRLWKFLKNGSVPNSPLFTEIRDSYGLIDESRNPLLEELLEGDTCLVLMLEKKNVADVWAWDCALSQQSYVSTCLPQPMSLPQISHQPSQPYDDSDDDDDLKKAIALSLAEVFVQKKRGRIEE
eukprot:TRINITY_DN3711_c0_g1_i1.p1 TRINITY_DN3711_c0_g1~~TRINITY_DN3711_c0_g1_i1.p1  ORF type:complete len:179 (+),score=36.10 TRINITY_DN3711_c0_g1_i1:31-567(+)